MTLYRLPALYMRGGTSKGLFFNEADLPDDPALRHALLIRAVGSPDPYGAQMDGMGTGISSTSKVVILRRSTQPDCDVDYWFGHVDIQRGTLDESGNCGNLSAAVGPAALLMGLLPAQGEQIDIRIWQQNLGQRIIATVPLQQGWPACEGDFKLDGLAFPGAAIQLAYLDPAGQSAGLFPTGQPLDILHLPDGNTLEATLLDCSNPLILVRAVDLGLNGTELPVEINADAGLLARLETIRASGAVAMGLARTVAEASQLRPATPKLALLSTAQDYASTTGEPVQHEEQHLTARILSMGKLHHAFTGTGSLALAVATLIPGTLAHALSRPVDGGLVRFGHPSGYNEVDATVESVAGQWQVRQVNMTRTARCLMQGVVWVPLEEH
ncbi:2-methylaconitate cis-trans isomerase PrpF family protein [Leeia aquatica]|nr:PrpF domain-containing protein [Leeia aquatica]